MENNWNVLATLRDTDQPVWRYILRAWLIAFIPSIIIAALIGLLIKNPDLPEFGDMPLPVELFGILIFSPVLETLLMWAILAIYRKFITKSILGLAVASALTWAGLHSAAAWSWGFGVFWPFFVFSVAFLEWRKKSIWKALCVVALIHMCQNTVPAIVLAVAGPQTHQTAPEYPGPAMEYQTVCE